MTILKNIEGKNEEQLKAIEDHKAVQAKIELENVRLSVSEIVGVFVNTFTAVDNWSFCNGGNLPEPTQLQLSKK